jgi:hypothetical protein
MEQAKKTLLPLVFTLMVLPLLAQEPKDYHPDLTQMMKEIRTKQINHTLMNGHSVILSPMMNRKVTLTVFMKDSTKLELPYTTFRLDTALKKFCLIHTDKDKRRSDSSRSIRIYPDETVKVTRLIGGTKLITGYPVDDCWLFPEIKGKITLYTMFTDIPNDKMEVQYVRGYSFDNGPVLPWNSNEMRKIIAADRDAAALYASGEYLRAVKLFNRNARKTEGKKEE